MRSEGGAECRKIQKEIRPTGEEDDSDPGVSGPPGGLKPDPDGNWGVSGGIVM